MITCQNVLTNMTNACISLSLNGNCYCYEQRCEGTVIGGLEADLWKIRAAALQYPRATVAVGTVHAGKVERGAARVAGSQGTPATGLRPRPAREKGFPSNLLLD
jgi:hypothetical protein